MPFLVFSSCSSKVCLCCSLPRIWIFCGSKSCLWSRCDLPCLTGWRDGALTSLLCRNPQPAQRAGSVPSLCFVDRKTRCVLRKKMFPYQQSNERFDCLAFEKRDRAPLSSRGEIRVGWHPLSCSDGNVHSSTGVTPVLYKPR